MVVVMWGRLGEGLKMIWWYTKYVVGLKKCSGRFLSWSIWPSGCRFYGCRSGLRFSTMERMALVPTGHWRNPLRARTSQNWPRSYKMRQLGQDQQRVDDSRSMRLPEALLLAIVLPASIYTSLWADIIRWPIRFSIHGNLNSYVDSQKL